MRRLASRTVAMIMLVTAAQASACMPPNIQFGLGSARLDAEALRTIDEVVREFQLRRGARVQLTAQTDGLGSRVANMRLARRRGEAVKAALIRRGVPAHAIDVEAVGERFGGGAAPEDRLVWLSVVTAPEGGPAAQAASC